MEQSGYNSQNPSKAPGTGTLKLGDTNYQNVFLKNWLVLVPLVLFLQQTILF